jgi:hypothetical protein
MGVAMFKVVRYDRIVRTSTRLLSTHLYQTDAIKSIAQSAIVFAEHGQHVEFVKSGFDIINENNKVVTAFRLEVGSDE